MPKMLNTISLQVNCIRKISKRIVEGLKNNKPDEGWGIVLEKVKVV